MSLTMLLRPRISEKAYGLSQAGNTYIFEVPGETNKTEVAAAVAAQFNVTVTSVNIMNRHGKVVRRFQRRGRTIMGTKPTIKKAYVSLKAGDSIAVFANEEDKSESKKAKREKKP